LGEGDVGDGGRGRGDGLCDHGRRRVGAEDVCEMGREVTRDEAVSAAEIDEEVFGTSVVGEDGGINGGWVGGSEGGVGRSRERRFPGDSQGGNG